MTTKIIAHALLTWTEDGRTRTAFHGESVDLPDEVVTYFERFGAFEPDEPEATVSLNNMVDTEELADEADPVTVEMTATEPPEKPTAAGTKAEWVDYAVAIGYDREEAEKATRADLIRSLSHPTEQEN